MYGLLFFSLIHHMLRTFTAEKCKLLHTSPDKILSRLLSFLQLLSLSSGLFLLFIALQSGKSHGQVKATPYPRSKMQQPDML